MQRGFVRGVILSFSLLVSAAQAQSLGPSSPPAAAESNLPPQTPVITINGYCDSPAASTPAVSAKSGDDKAGKAVCKTEITRAQFEKLHEATQPFAGPAPRVPPNANYRLASRYPEVLVFSKEARELGLDKDPLYLEKLRFAELQVLADMLTKHLEDEAQSVTDADVAKYYKDHPEEFEEVELLRVFVPKKKQHPADPDAKDQAQADPAADEAAMKVVAEKIAAEAAAGGDFEKLQEEAYTAAGQEDPPPVDLGKTFRSEVPTYVEKDIFDMPVGKTSGVVAGPIGWYILKVVSRDTLPLEKARGVLVSQRMKRSMEAAKQGVNIELNRDYFKPISRK